MTEEIEQRWQRLSVTAEEEDAIQGKESEKTLVVQKGKKSLIGKLAGSKTANREALCRVMNMLWKPRKSLKVQEIDENLFIFEFTEEQDKARVLGGCPWLFYRYLLLLHEFDGLTPPREFTFKSSLLWVQECVTRSNQKEQGLVGTLQYGAWLRADYHVKCSSPRIDPKPMVEEEEEDEVVAETAEQMQKEAGECSSLRRVDKDDG
ncbi:Zinc finger, CCHC-type [Fagus crenata]